MYDRLHRIRPLRFREILFGIPLKENPEFTEIHIVRTVRPFRAYRRKSKDYRFYVLLPVDYDGYSTWYEVSKDV